jgi:hypothetical protein
MKTLTFYEKKIPFDTRNGKISSDKWVKEWIVEHPDECEWIANHATEYKIVLTRNAHDLTYVTSFIGLVTEQDYIWYKLKYV